MDWSRGPRIGRGRRSTGTEGGCRVRDFTHHGRAEWEAGGACEHAPYGLLQGSGACARRSGQSVVLPPSRPLTYVEGRKRLFEIQPGDVVKRETFRARNIIFALIFILVGVVLIAVSDTQWRPKGIDLGTILSTLGTILIVSPIFNFFFDLAAKEKLFDEILDRTGVSYGLANSGIVAVYTDSKKIDFQQHILRSRRIFCLFSYAGNFIKNYEPDIASALERGTTIEIAHLAEDSDLIRLMIDQGWPNESIAAGFRGIDDFTKRHAANMTRITVTTPAMIPRYSLVGFDDRVFVIENTASMGRMRVPAMEILRDSPLGNFYIGDMQRLGMAK
jgi:hypothetical protein